jgi:hypothetical protein
VLCRCSLACAVLCYVAHCQPPPPYPHDAQLETCSLSRLQSAALTPGPAHTSVLEATTEAQSGIDENVEDHFNEVTGITTLLHGSVGVITYQPSTSRQHVVEVVLGKGAVEEALLGDATKEAPCGRWNPSVEHQKICSPWRR